MSFPVAKSIEVLEEYLENNDYVALYYFVYGGFECGALEPVLDELYNTRYPDVEFVKVNLKNPDFSVIQKANKITSVPHMLFYNKREVVGSVKGAELQDIVDNLDKLQAEGGVEGKGRHQRADKVTLEEIQPYTVKGFEPLNSYIDYDRFIELNVVANGGNAFRLDLQSVLWSDTDSQLMFFVPFLNATKVQSILIKSKPVVVDEDDGEEGQVPTSIKVWANLPTPPSFESAESDSNSGHSQKLIFNDDGWAEIKLRYVRFQNVQSLCFFIDGADEDLHTIIQYIVVNGVAGKSLEISTFEDFSH